MIRKNRYTFKHLADDDLEELVTELMDNINRTRDRLNETVKNLKEAKEELNRRKEPMKSAWYGAEL